jgi:hypothetical protein
VARHRRPLTILSQQNGIPSRRCRIPST